MPEPLRETAFRFLVRIHLAEGNLAEAVRQYRTFARLLEFELAAQPSESMRKPIDGNLSGSQVRAVASYGNQRSV